MENNEDQNSINETDFKNHPTTWFGKRFPEVYRKYNKPIDMSHTKDGVHFVKNISEDFLAETLGSLGKTEFTNSISWS